MKKNLYLNGVNLGNYGIYISSDTVLNAPSFDYTEHQVPGRNGSVLQYNKRLNNVVRKFTCHIPYPNMVNSGITSLKRLLYSNPGYIRITSDYEPGYYQYGYLAQEFNVTPFNLYRNATFELYFSCLPEKISEVQASGSNQYALMADDYEFQGCFPRNSDLVRNIFNDIEPTFIPSDDYFYVYHIPYSSGGFTNLTASWSEGDMFMAVFGAEGIDYYQQMFGYTNSDLSISSATYDYGFYLICPVYLEGTITVNFTDEDSDPRTFTTNDISNKVETLSNNSAFGCRFDTFEVDFRPMNAFGVKTAEAILFFESYANGEKVGSMAVSLKPNTMGNARNMLSKYFTAITQKTNSLIANIDLENKTAVFAKAGLSDLPADSYFEFTGDLGMYDTLKMFAPCTYPPEWYEGSTINPGYAYVNSFECDGKWWAL